MAAVVLSHRPRIVGDLIALAGNWEGLLGSKPAAAGSPSGRWVPSWSDPAARTASAPEPDAAPGVVRATDSDSAPEGDAPGPDATASYPKTPFPDDLPLIPPTYPPPSMPRFAPGNTPGYALSDAGASPPVQSPDRVPAGPARSQDPGETIVPWRSGPAQPSNRLGRERPFVPDAPIQAGPLPSHQLLPCEGSEVVARVGGEVILGREVSRGMAEVRAQNKDRMPPEALEAEIRKLMQKRLEQRIQQKLLYQDAKRKAPAEGLKRIEEMIAKDFEEKEIPRLMKESRAASRRDLEDLLARMDLTLEMQKREFIEGGVASLWLREQVKPNEDVGHGEMLSCYREHIAEFETPARARWEQLMIRKGFDPGSAYAKLCQMGNQVLGGASFAEVAKAGSDGPTAKGGGGRDWTTQGSLVSTPLDRAIFSPALQPGQLSEIIEDEQGFHIIRIVERQDVVRQSFKEAQVAIREKIRKRRQSDAMAAFLAQLRKQTPVWTAFDAQTAVQSPSGFRAF